MKNAFRNWSDVRIFGRGRAGSALAASKELGIAQPTVARRIEALEHETGLTLFERDTRGFRPTETGAALVPLAEALETAAGAFAAKSVELSRPRRIRITAYSANFSPRAAQIYSAFSALHPEVQFEFLPSVKVLDLRRGEADIALRLTRSRPDPDLICRRISTARFTLFGTRAYADRYGLPDSPDRLDGHTFVTFRRDDAPPVLHD
ncbi:MAG: LysR family transcriptional regulator [Paracoccaceae bacterium]